MPKPTNRSIDLLRVARWIGIERGIEHQQRDQQDQRQRHQERDGRFALQRPAQAERRRRRRSPALQCRIDHASFQLQSRSDQRQRAHHPADGSPLPRAAAQRRWPVGSGSSIASASSGPHEAFDLALGPGQGLFHRLALHEAHDHLGLDRLGVDLMGDLAAAPAPRRPRGSGDCAGSGSGRACPWAALPRPRS